MAINDPVPFSELPTAPLTLDRTYLGGHRGNAADDPLARLLPVGNQGGFRYNGSVQRKTVRMCVLYTSQAEPDWPDRLNTATGDFTYFGDNRKPGSGLLDTRRRGNQLLEQSFAAARLGAEERATVAPYFLFERAGSGRDVVFRGLLAPGSARLTPEEELVAVWRTTDRRRFQNYRAHFTVLDVPEISRSWLTEMQAGSFVGDSAPAPWLEWVARRTYRALEAPRSISVRRRTDQLPQHRDGVAVLRKIREWFSDDPHRFEGFAADIWMASDPHVESVDVTRPSRDGGRDAVGSFLVGPSSDPIRIDFALEAKCYAPTNSVGVREMSRLISRLRTRQFGVLVTTSFLADQAYQEIREDEHPIAVIAGADIVEILSSLGHRTAEEVQWYLQTHHPRPAAAADIAFADDPAVDLDTAAMASPASRSAERSPGQRGNQNRLSKTQRRVEPGEQPLA